MAGRTKNTIRNASWGMVYNCLTLILAFISRTIFLKFLGTEYLGLNSLFASILQVLNMAELGVGSAIVFAMYEPIAKGRTEEVCALMNYYKKAYRIIGSIIAGVGILLIPFLDKLISGERPADINLYILYLIYLCNTVLSYFLFAYKTVILNVNQRRDLLTKIDIGNEFLKFVLQMVALIGLHNYYAYIIILPITTVLSNLAGAFLSKKYYPMYLCKGSVSVQTRAQMKRQIQGIMIGKMVGVAMHSLDSIIISAVLGLVLVGKYNNYYYIISSINGMLIVIVNAMRASIGNKVACENETVNFKDLQKFNHLYLWIGSWISICLLCCYQPFMKIWGAISNADLMLPFGCVIAFVFYFYTTTMGTILSLYSDAKGLFYELRYRYIVELIFNLVLNITLIQMIGVAGIAIATALSILLVACGYGSWLVFKAYFGREQFKIYWRQQVMFMGELVVGGIITYTVCNWIPLIGWEELIAKVGICLIAPNAIFILLNYHSKTHQEAWKYVKSMLPVLRK